MGLGQAGDLDQFELAASSSYRSKPNLFEVFVGGENSLTCSGSIFAEIIRKATHRSTT